MEEILNQVKRSMRVRFLKKKKFFKVFRDVVSFSADIQNLLHAILSNLL